jgi:hypothetical protein
MASANLVLEKMNNLLALSADTQKHCTSDLLVIEKTEKCNRLPVQLPHICPKQQLTDLRPPF